MDYPTNNFNPINKPIPINNFNNHQIEWGTHDEPDYQSNNDLTNAFQGPQQSRKPTIDNHDPTNGAIPAASSRFQSINPQVLLNPKGAVAQNAFNRVMSDTDGGSYQDPNQMTNDMGSDMGLGVGGYLERQFRIQNREHYSLPTQQKRKRVEEIEDDDEQDRAAKAKTSTTSSIRSGGTLSDHMRKEREQMAADAGPAAMPIDLTTDDEVQVIKENLVENPGNDEICLGMIKAKVNTHRIPSVSVRAMNSIGSSHWPRTKVEYKRSPAEHNVIDLLDRAGKIGKLDPTTSLALCPLLDRTETTKLRINMWLDERPRAPTEKPGMPVSIYISASVLLYARRSASEKIGKWLSQKGVFLSPPFGAGATYREYDNPQMPKDYSGRGGQVANRTQQLQTSSTMTRTVEEMRREAGSMIDSLVKHEDLPEMEADARYITTSLLSHQKQGLHFLTEHERADQDSGFSLWKPTQKKNGGDMWYNVITGHQLHEKPDPVQGGILADMMGLGKTLSILSLIAATRSEATEFAKIESADEDEECRSKATLIVCPKSVMSNWYEQIRTHTKRGTFKVYAYHGTTRTQSVEELAKHDIVLTTYNTAGAESTKKNRALASINWFRIVLDEAHQIRNQNTRVSKACCALTAQRRWAVTGTPVQNTLNDLGALIKFLRIRPFDQGQAWAQFILAPFRMANTDVIQHLRLLVDSITLRRLKDNIDLTERTETRVRLDFTDEEGKIYARVAGNSGRQLRLMAGNDTRLKGKSYAHVLKSIGRMRMLCAHGLDMLNEDDRKEIVDGMDPTNAIAIDLGDEPSLEEFKFVTDRQAYETLHMMSDSDVNRCIKCGRKVGEAEEQETEDEDGDDSSSSSSSEDDSSSEHGDDTIGYLTPCYHLVCPNCKPNHDATIKPILTDDERHVCQYCETYVRHGIFELHRSKFHAFIDARSTKAKNAKTRRWDESNYNGPSTKVRALIDDLKKSLEETKKLGPDEPPIRSVVFSGWTTYLSLIEVALEENGIGYVRLDGSMSIRARTAVLDRFKSEPEVVVLLVSIKAGGQGLNFTAANKVYMMEPQFNPGTEQQAIDRVHRLGQKRDVFITYYIMNKSVEEGVLKLQDKKEKLANLSLNRKLSPAEMQKQKLEDLKELFK